MLVLQLKISNKGWDHHQLCFGEGVALEEKLAKTSHTMAVLIILED
jgi:hypothetical protein